MESFITEQKNKSTTRKTKQHLDIFIEFLETKNENRAPHTIPPPDLDEYLASFVVSIKKISEDGQDVQDYEPCTIKGMQSSIARYQKEKKYAASIIQSDVFFKSREAIAAKCKHWKRWVEGTGLTVSVPLLLRRSRICGVVELLAIHLRVLSRTRCGGFGLRANKENYDLRWGDMELKEGDKPYLTRRERSTTTRQGENITDIRDEVQVYEDDDQPQYCPVRLTISMPQNDHPRCANLKLNSTFSRKYSAAGKGTCLVQQSSMYPFVFTLNFMFKLKVSVIIVKYR